MQAFTPGIAVCGIRKPTETTGKSAIAGVASNASNTTMVWGSGIGRAFLGEELARVGGIGAAGEAMSSR